MEASSTRRPFGGGSQRDLLSSRKGAFGLAALSALAAGLLLFLFVSSQDDGGSGGASNRVLIAKSLIPKGSTGDVVASQQLAVPATLSGDDRKEGAISDPSALRGQVATADVYPGQQITAADFKVSDVGVSAKLAGDQRAVAVPVDETHGLIGNVSTGDRVDVMVGFTQTGQSGVNRPVLRTLLQNILVLDAPSGDGGVGGEATSVVLRTRDEDAVKLAFAADNGKVWIVLRPPAGARQTRPSTVTLQSLLSGTTPIPEDAG